MGDQDKKDIAEILDIRANEIAKYRDGIMKDVKHLGGSVGGVDLALTMEMGRLRDLADKVSKLEVGE